MQGESNFCATIVIDISNCILIKLSQVVLGKWVSANFFLVFHYTFEKYSVGKFVVVFLQGGGCATFFKKY